MDWIGLVWAAGDVGLWVRAVLGAVVGLGLRVWLRLEFWLGMFPAVPVVGWFLRIWARGLGLGPRSSRVGTRFRPRPLWPRWVCSHRRRPLSWRLRRRRPARPICRHQVWRPRRRGGAIWACVQFPHRPTGSRRTRTGAHRDRQRMESRAQRQRGARGHRSFLGGQPGSLCPPRQ